MSPLYGTYHDNCCINMKCAKTLKDTSISRCDISGDNHKDIRFIDAITVISK